MPRNDELSTLDKNLKVALALIDSLKNKINTQENKISTLENKIHALERDIALVRGRLGNLS